MALKGLLSTLTYKPFSYEEMLAPVLLATQAHQAQEEAYTDLLSNASSWEQTLSTDPNDPARKLYDSYMNDLKKASDSLLTNGLSPHSKKDLMKLKSRYKSDIGAIEKADTEYRNMLKAREGLLAKDNSIIFNTNYSGLSDFLNGMPADNQHISLKEITGTTAARAQAVSYSIYNKLIAEGKTPDQALTILATGNTPELKDIVNKELLISNAANRDTNTQNLITEAINTGIQSAANDIAQKEYISAKERESLNLQKNNNWLNTGQFRLSESRFKGELAKNGLKEVTKDGVTTIEIDESSPVWKKDSNGNIVGKIGAASSKTPTTTKTTKNKEYLRENPIKIPINNNGEIIQADKAELDKNYLITGSKVLNEDNIIDYISEEVIADIETEYGMPLEEVLKYYTIHWDGAPNKKKGNVFIKRKKGAVEVNSIENEFESEEPNEDA